MTSNLPLIACSLHAGEQQTRLVDWAELLGQARVREETPFGVRYSFAADDDLKTRVEALAAAEQNCCSFLTFDVSRRGEEIEMIVTAPPGGQAALRFIFPA
jgi:hypothetical protein